MASLIVAGNTSGSVTISAPDVASTPTLTLPTVSGTIITTGSSGQSIPSAALPAGSVLQVVQGKLSTSFSTTSTSAVDTGLTATITPKFSTSKVLCFITVNGIRTDNTTYNSYLYLNRNGTNLDNIGTGGSYYLYFASTQLNGRVGTAVNMVLDTPSTTSATTYKLQLATENSSSTSFINNQNSQLTPSTIILMEIAA